ncbi:MAG: hypothetical protein V1839_02945 [archaeon]
MEAYEYVKAGEVLSELGEIKLVDAYNPVKSFYHCVEGAFPSFSNKQEAIADTKSGKVLFTTDISSFRQTLEDLVSGTLQSELGMLSRDLAEAYILQIKELFPQELVIPENTSGKDVLGKIKASPDLRAMLDKSLGAKKEYVMFLAAAHNNSMYGLRMGLTHDDMVNLLDCIKAGESDCAAKYLAPLRDEFRKRSYFELLDLLDRMKVSESDSAVKFLAQLKNEIREMDADGDRLYKKFVDACEDPEPERLNGYISILNGYKSGIEKVLENSDGLNREKKTGLQVKLGFVNTVFSRLKALQSIREKDYPYFDVKYCFDAGSVASIQPEYARTMLDAINGACKQYANSAAVDIYKQFGAYCKNTSPDLLIFPFGKRFFYLGNTENPEFLLKVWYNYDSETTQKVYKTIV